MRLYAHHAMDIDGVISTPRIAWLNRMTHHERGVLRSEVWLLMLPSWCMMESYSDYRPDAPPRMHQRFVYWDSVTGTCGAGAFPVEHLP